MPFKYSHTANRKRKRPLHLPTVQHSTRLYYRLSAANSVKIVLLENMHLQARLHAHCGEYMVLTSAVLTRVMQACQ